MDIPYCRPAGGHKKNSECRNLHLIIVDGGVVRIEGVGQQGLLGLTSEEILKRFPGRDAGVRWLLLLPWWQQITNTYIGVNISE